MSIASAKNKVNKLANRNVNRHANRNVSKTVNRNVNKSSIDMPTTIIWFNLVEMSINW